MVRNDHKPQYEHTQKKAFHVLLKYSEGKLPIDPFEIVKKIKNIELKTYTEFAKELQKKNPALTVDEIKKSFESNNGFLKKKGKKKYILCYNELDNINVIRWTIAHELGHYFLEHLLESENEYLRVGDNYEKVMETEANNFAKQLLTPFPIIFSIINHFDTMLIYSDEIAEIFKINKLPAQYISEHFYNARMSKVLPVCEELVAKFSDAVKNIRYKFERNWSIEDRMELLQAFWTLGID